MQKGNGSKVNYRGNFIQAINYYDINIRNTIERVIKSETYKGPVKQLVANGIWQVDKDQLAVKEA